MYNVLVLALSYGYRMVILWCDTMVRLFMSVSGTVVRLATKRNSSDISAAANMFKIFIEITRSIQFL